LLIEDIKLVLPTITFFTNSYRHWLLSRDTSILSDNNTFDSRDCRAWRKHSLCPRSTRDFCFNTVPNSRSTIWFESKMISFDRKYRQKLFYLFWQTHLFITWIWRSTNLNLYLGLSETQVLPRHIQRS